MAKMKYFDGNQWVTFDADTLNGKRADNTANNIPVLNGSGQLLSSQLPPHGTHVPDGGTSTKYLRGDGVWEIPTDTNTWRPVETAPTTSTSNSISSSWAKAHGEGVGNGKHIPAAGSAGQFLAYNGTWATPPNTNTTYSAGTALTLSGTTFNVNLGSGSTQAAPGNHSHNYAGSSSAGGAATSAQKLSSARTISLTGDVTGSTSFDGSSNVSITATVADDSHLHNAMYYTKTEIDNTINPKKDYLRHNLGSPSVTEMALIDAEATNKLWFYDPSLMSFETSTDNSTWTPKSISSQEVKKLVSGNSTSSIQINKGEYFRITINPNSYVYLNWLYMYFSSNGDNIQVMIERKRNDSQNWEVVSPYSNTANTWPGHVFLAHHVIAFSSDSTNGHYNKVRITIKAAAATNASKTMTLYGLEWWGGYPSGRRTIYGWDENKNVSFPADISSTGNIYVGNNAVYHAGNKPTPADIGAANSSHSHSYDNYGGWNVKTSSNSTAYKVTSNGNITIKGTGASTVTHDSSGNITINSTDTKYTHPNDANTRHVTDAEKSAWNAKETTSGAQSKADAALNSAKTYADSKVAELVNSAPETLNTLNELSAALGNDPNFATTIASKIGAKSDKTYVDAELAKKSDVHSHPYLSSSGTAVAASKVTNKLTFTGGSTVQFDGSAAATVNIPTVPSSLKNPNALTIKGNGTLVYAYDGSSSKTLNIKPGSNVSIGSDTSGNITISSTDTNTWRGIETSPSTSTSNSISSSWAKTHQEGVGNGKHVPAAGSTSQYLRGDGVWATPPNTTYGVVSKTANGLTPMLPNETSTTKYLRQDGAWVVPPNTNTTYSAGTALTLSGTTFSVNLGTGSNQAAPGNHTHAYDNYGGWNLKTSGNSTATKITSNGTTTFKGSSATTVTHDSSGNVTISSPVYIPSTSATTATTAGWYRIAQSPVSISNCGGTFYIKSEVSGYHAVTVIDSSISYGVNPVIQQVSHSPYSGAGITKARIVYSSDYNGKYAYLEIYKPHSTAMSISVRVVGVHGWSLVSPSTVGSIPSGYSNKEIQLIPGGMQSIINVSSSQPAGNLNGRVWIQTY